MLKILWSPSASTLPIESARSSMHHGKGFGASCTVCPRSLESFGAMRVARAAKTPQRLAASTYKKIELDEHCADKNCSDWCHYSQQLRKSTPSTHVAQHPCSSATSSCPVALSYSPGPHKRSCEGCRCLDSTLTLLSLLILLRLDTDRLKLHAACHHWLSTTIYCVLPDIMTEAVVRLHELDCRDLWSIGG